MREYCGSCGTGRESKFFKIWGSTFRAWELILHFKFGFFMNSTDADIVITFVLPKHRLFDGDNHFSADSLAHAYFLENGEYSYER